MAMMMVCVSNRLPLSVSVNVELSCPVWPGFGVMVSTSFASPRSVLPTEACDQVFSLPPGASWSFHFLAEGLVPPRVAAPAVAVAVTLAAGGRSCYFLQQDRWVCLRKLISPTGFTKPNGRGCHVEEQELWRRKMIESVASAR